MNAQYLKSRSVMRPPTLSPSSVKLDHGRQATQRAPVSQLTVRSDLRSAQARPGLERVVERIVEQVIGVQAGRHEMLLARLHHHRRAAHVDLVAREIGIALE